MRNKHFAKIFNKLIAFIIFIVLGLSCAACGNNKNVIDPDSGYDQEHSVPEHENVSAETESDNEEFKTESDYTDYTRAFLKEYVSAEYADRVLSEQISSVEYKAMLEQLITYVDETKLSYFREKVSDYDTPLLRGQAVTMSYYAAVCIGADNYNNSFDHSDADGGDFWGTDGEHFETLFPQCFGEPVIVGSQEWQNEYVASYLWNIWHSSPYSGFQTIAFDPVAMSMHNHDPFTVEDAVCAITRLYDSAPTKAVFISIDDPKAKIPNADVLTQDLMDKATASQIFSIEDLPRLTGFVLANNCGYGTTTISTLPPDIKRIAEWGFTSARIMLTYETLFSEDVDYVNIAELVKLDDLVAAAIENNLHLNLLLCTLPGRTTWYDDGFVSGGDFDMFVNKSKQEDAVRIWKLLAERYSDIPGNTYLLLHSGRLPMGTSPLMVKYRTILRRHNGIRNNSCPI